MSETSDPFAVLGEALPFYDPTGELLEALSTIRSRYEEMARGLVGAEPESHKTARPLHGVDREGCLWCLARNALSTTTEERTG